LRQAIDVHKIRERYDHAVKNLKADSSLSERNRRTILRFIWNLQAEGIGLPRLVKYLHLLPLVAKGSKKHRVKSFQKDFADKITVIAEKYAAIRTVDFMRLRISEVGVGSSSVSWRGVWRESCCLSPPTLIEQRLKWDWCGWLLDSCRKRNSVALEEAP